MSEPTTTPVVNNNGQEPDGQQPGADGDTFSRSYVEQIRAEAAKYRLAAKELTEKLGKYQEAELSDKERIEKRVKEAEEAMQATRQQLQRERVEKAIMLAAIEEGISPQLAIKLAEVQTDESGNPVGVGETVKTLATTYPQLVTTKAVSTTNPANAPTKNKAATLTRADIEKMSLDEINANWDKVQAALKP